MGIKTINPNNKNPVVIQHNKLIEARYRATLHQKRIMLWIISEIDPEEDDLQTYRVSIKELAKFMGLENNRDIYEQISQATKGMVSQLIEIGSLDTEKYIQTSLLSSAEYVRGKGYVDLEISKALKPYLLDLKANFTQAYLKDLAGFRSIYAVRLYELLIQYRRMKKRTFEVDELKTILGIKDKYKLYGHFKRIVLNTAVKELNADSDIEVDFKEIKTGKKVTSLEFKFKKKAGFEIASDERTILVSELRKHGLNKDQANKIFDLYGETDPDRITGAIAKLEKEMKNKEISSPTAWLVKAINEDWRDKKTAYQEEKEAEKKQAVEKAEQKRRNTRKADQIDHQIRELEDKYILYRKNFVLNAIENLSEQDRSSWETEFTAQLKGDFRARHWKENREWGSRLFFDRAVPFVETKTETTCLTGEQYFEQNELPSVKRLKSNADKLRNTP